ncbi:MAG: hypothetical protein AABX08_04315 [Nanoarchaeota archaeon]
MICQTALARLKQKNHDRFLEKIVRDGLYRRISVLEDQQDLKTKIWKEPYFTTKGIVINRDLIGFRENLGQPDLLIYVESPVNKVIVLEVKLSNNKDLIMKMMEELENYRAYIDSHRNDLYKFLNEGGINPIDIDNLQIGFSGIVSTQRGRSLKEVTYFELGQS